MPSSINTETDRTFRTKRNPDARKNPARGGDKRLDPSFSQAVAQMRQGEGRVVQQLRSLRPDPRNPKILHYKMLRLLTERFDDQGNRIPFRVLYAAKNGDIIDDVCVCTNVEPHKHRRTVVFVGGQLPRTLRDVLILEVNDHKILVT